MKILKWIGYIFAGIGAILISIGIFAAITLEHRLDAVYIATYLLAGNSFLLFTVVILLFSHINQHKKV